MSKVEIGTRVLYSYDAPDNQENPREKDAAVPVLTTEAEVTAVRTNGNVDLSVILDDSDNRLAVENITYNQDPKPLAGTYQLK